MNLGMVGNLPKVVLDTNILISALGFEGKPNQVLRLALDRKIQLVTSEVLLVELQEVISKKFPQLGSKLPLIMKRIRKRSQIVQPKESLNISRDKDDNRVLEAAIEGECTYIITGDKDLLDLKQLKNVKILTAEQFLSKEII